MFRTFLIVLSTLSLATTAVAIDPPMRPTPIVRQLAPDPVKAGATFVATGQGITKDAIAEAYLTKGDNTYKLEIVEIAANALTVRVPATMQAGHYGFMILTKGDVPRYIDEPVFIDVE